MEHAREVPCAAPELPAGIAEALHTLGTEWVWARSTVGQSDGKVWRLTSAQSGTAHYLKHGTGEVAEDLQSELVRLRWLAQHMPVPQVAAFVHDSDAAWLLMTAVPGETAWEVLTAHPEQSGAVVDAIAAFLRQIHAIAPDSCPFNASAKHRLVLARAWIAAGLIDEDDFDDARAGWSAAQVWEAQQALLLPEAPLVVTHGDF